MIAAGKTKKAQAARLARERAKVRRFDKHVRKEAAYIAKAKKRQAAAEARNTRNLDRVDENGKIIDRNKQRINDEAAKARAKLKQQSKRVAMEKEKYGKESADAKARGRKDVWGARVALDLAHEAHSYAIRMWWKNARESLDMKQKQIRDFNNRIFGMQFAKSHAEDYELMSFTFGIQPEQLYAQFQEPSRYPEGNEIEGKRKNVTTARQKLAEINRKIAKVQASLEKDRNSIIAKDREMVAWAKENLQKQLEERRKLLDARKQLLAERDDLASGRPRIEEAERNLEKKKQQLAKAKRAVGLA